MTVKPHVRLYYIVWYRPDGLFQERHVRYVNCHGLKAGVEFYFENLLDNRPRKILDAQSQRLFEKVSESLRFSSIWG